jgi:hypothetical protein
LYSLQLLKEESGVFFKSTFSNERGLINVGSLPDIDLDERFFEVDNFEGGISSKCTRGRGDRGLSAAIADIFSSVLKLFLFVRFVLKTQFREGKKKKVTVRFQVLDNSFGQDL